MICNIKDLNLNYEIIGDGIPILMLHGFFADSNLMSGCMEPILIDNKNYKRIYLDLPGMGESIGGKWIKNSDEILDIVLEFIEKIIPNEEFLLVGESYGGYISLGLLHKIASKVKGLLLICPCVIAPMEKRNLPEHVVLECDKDFTSKLSERDLHKFNERVVVQNSKTWQRFENEVLYGVKICDRELLKNIKENGYEFSFDARNLKEKFIKPTTMLVGRQDAIVGYKDAFEMLDDFPRATFAVIDKSGHNLQFEQEEIFNIMVKDWLAKF
ncbi:alpha/beta hydrolase [Clostridium sp. ATCC 25772]|uniref:alpha/beta fold hydrolase n=1 Tax=Clostridium sp. ATCC 25772 TaxID=1676991 RepID=UPI0007861DBD|nr:alpha/beta hydrolase [Clostridium sp. ATCC 25772]